MCVVLNWKLSCSHSRQYSDWAAQTYSLKWLLCLSLPGTLSLIFLSLPLSSLMCLHILYVHSACWLWSQTIPCCGGTGYWSVVAWWSFLAIVYCDFWLLRYTFFSLANGTWTFCLVVSKASVYGYSLQYPLPLFDGYTPLQLVLGLPVQLAVIRHLLSATYS